MTSAFYRGVAAHFLMWMVMVVATHLTRIPREHPEQFFAASLLLPLVFTSGLLSVISWAMIWMSPFLLPPLRSARGWIFQAWAGAGSWLLLGWILNEEPLAFLMEDGPEMSPALGATAAVTAILIAQWLVRPDALPKREALLPAPCRLKRPSAGEVSPRLRALRVRRQEFITGSGEDSGEVAHMWFVWQVVRSWAMLLSIGCIVGIPTYVDLQAGEWLREKELSAGVLPHLLVPAPERRLPVLIIAADGAVTFGSDFDLPASDRALRPLKDRLVREVNEFGGSETLRIVPQPEVRHQRLIDVLNAVTCSGIRNYMLL